MFRFRRAPLAAPSPCKPLFGSTRTKWFCLKRLQTGQELPFDRSPKAMNPAETELSSLLLVTHSCGGYIRALKGR
jgi:hypothetical protein